LRPNLLREIRVSYSYSAFTLAGELAPCMLAEDQNRSQRILRVTHRDGRPASATSTQLLPPPPLKLLFRH